MPAGNDRGSQYPQGHCRPLRGCGSSPSPAFQWPSCGQQKAAARLRKPSCLLPLRSWPLIHLVVNRVLNGAPTVDIMPRPACRVMWEKHGGAVREYERRIHADHLSAAHGVMVWAVVRSRAPAMAPTLDHLVGPDALLLHGLPERLVASVQHGIRSLGAGDRISPRLEQRTLILPLADGALSLWHRFALSLLS